MLLNVPVVAAKPPFKVCNPVITFAPSDAMVEGTVMLASGIVHVRVVAAVIANTSSFNIFVGVIALAIRPSESVRGCEMPTAELHCQTVLAASRWIVQDALGVGTFEMIRACCAVASEGRSRKSIERIVRFIEPPSDARSERPETDEIQQPYIAQREQSLGVSAPPNDATPIHPLHPRQYPPQEEPCGGPAKVAEEGCSLHLSRKAAAPWTPNQQPH
ncbi:MAG: hypothetical protein AABW93_03065 [Nanoarchaeota archaeon]